MRQRMTIVRNGHGMQDRPGADPHFIVRDCRSLAPLARGEQHRCSCISPTTILALNARPETEHYVPWCPNFSAQRHHRLTGDFVHGVWRTQYQT
jgi:hypothetical protein